MFLHYFKKKENIDKGNPEIIYLNLIKSVKAVINNKKLYLNNDLNSSFEIATFLLCCLFHDIKNSSSKGKKQLSDELMKIFIKDLDHSFRISGVSDMKIGKTVKIYVKKFYFRLKKLNIVFDNQVIEEYLEYFNSLDIFINKKDKKNLVEFLFNNSNKLLNSIKKDH